MSGGFEDLGLLPELVRATQDQHWILPSDVQDESIPLILGGGDVMVVRLGAAFSHCCRSLASPLHLTPPSSLLPSYCRLLRLAAARRVPLPCQPFSSCSRPSAQSRRARRARPAPPPPPPPQQLVVRVALPWRRAHPRRLPPF